MQYIHLSDDSYILHTSEGTAHLTLNSFNFNKIKKLVGAGAAEEEILPLLIPPELPDGVFNAYKCSSTGTILYQHLTMNSCGITTKYAWLGKDIGYYLENKGDAVFVGTYASYKDLVYDYPEYLI